MVFTNLLFNNANYNKDTLLSQSVKGQEVLCEDVASLFVRDTMLGFRINKMHQRLIGY